MKANFLLIALCGVGWYKFIFICGHVDGTLGGWGEMSAWYLLYAHAHQFPKILYH